MRDLRVGIFEHMYINYRADLYLRMKYTKNNTAGNALKNSLAILFVYKDMANSYARYQWTLREAK